MPWLYSSRSEEQNLDIFIIYLLFSIFNWRNLFSQSIIYGALFENVEERSVAQNIYTGLLSFSKVCDKLVNNDLLITLRNAIFFFLISSMLSGRLVRLWIFCQLQMLELPGISTNSTWHIKDISREFDKLLFLSRMESLDRFSVAFLISHLGIVSKFHF